MGDEEVFRHKLMVDGDGLGDDRRITTLLKIFIKWCVTDDNEEDSKMIYERMLAAVAQCESTMIKSRLTSQMNAEEMHNYEMLCNDIENSIANAHTKIKKCKEELQKAKRIRKNRQEYDLLAKVVQQHPDRKQTAIKLKQLDKELKELFQTRDDQEEKLNLRRKQFAILQNSIYELQLLLDADEASSEVPEMKMDTMDTLS